MIKRAGLIKIIVLILISQTGLSGCDNQFVITPGIEFENNVNGIYLTNELSSNPIGVWGNPNAIDPFNIFNGVSGFNTFQFSFSTPYPNPSDGNFTMQYSLPVASQVFIWLESATWAGDKANLPLTINRPEQVFFILDGITQSAGLYSQRSTASTLCYGGNLYPGFYRVYFQANTLLTWQDVYLFGPEGSNPSGLEPIYTIELSDCISD